MTGQIETPIAEQNPSRWQMVMAWFTAFEQVMAYDPQEYTDATIKRLRAEVAQLETRVLARERGRNATA